MRKQKEKYENMYHIKENTSQAVEKMTVSSFLDSPLPKIDSIKEQKKTLEEDKNQNEETHSTQRYEQKLSLSDEYQKQLRNKKQQEEEKKKAEDLENIGKLRHKLQEENAAHQAAEEKKKQQMEQNIKEEEHNQNNRPTLEDILYKKQSQADIPLQNEIRKGGSKQRQIENHTNKEIQNKLEDNNQNYKRQPQVAFVQTQMKQQEQQFHDNPNPKYREQYNKIQDDDDDDDEEDEQNDDESTENSTDEDEQQQIVLHKPEIKYNYEEVEEDDSDENFNQQRDINQDDDDDDIQEEEQDQNDNEYYEDESQDEIVQVQQFKGNSQKMKVIEREPKNDDKFKYLLPKSGKNINPQQKIQQQQKHQNSEEHFFRLPEEKPEKKNRNTATCDDETSGQACSLCETNQVFSLDTIEWQSKYVPKQNQKENQQLLEFLLKLLGESNIFVSFSQNANMCIVGEKFNKQVPIDFLLKQFTGNGLDFYQKDNQFLEIPQQLQPSYLEVEAKFEPSKRVFVFKNFLVKAPYQNELKYSKNGSFKMREISFAQRQFQISYDGFANQKKQFHYEQRNGGEKTEMILKDLILPNDNAIVSFLAEKYLGGEFKQQVKNFESEGFHGNLQINTIKTDNHIALSFNLFKLE